VAGLGALTPYLVTMIQYRLGYISPMAALEDLDNYRQDLFLYLGLALLGGVILEMIVSRLIKK